MTPSSSTSSKATASAKNTRRELNRLAAERCRRRKNALFETLKETCAQLTARVQQLEAANAALRMQLSAVEGTNAAYRDHCDTLVQEGSWRRYRREHGGESEERDGCASTSSYDEYSYQYLYQQPQPNQEQSNNQCQLHSLQQLQPGQQHLFRERLLGSFKCFKRGFAVVSRKSTKPDSSWKPCRIPQCFIIAFSC